MWHFPNLSRHIDFLLLVELDLDLLLGGRYGLLLRSFGLWSYRLRNRLGRCLILTSVVVNFLETLFICDRRIQVVLIVVFFLDYWLLLPIKYHFLLLLLAHYLCHPAPGCDSYRVTIDATGGAAWILFP